MCHKYFVGGVIVFAVGFSAHARTIEKILAIVNDEIVTQTDLESYKTKLSSGGLVDDALLRTANTKELLADRTALVNHLVDERVIDSEVKRLGLSVTIERIEQEVRSISKRNGISRENLKDALKEKKVNYSEYQDFIRTSLERQSLIEKEISSKIKISDDDVSSYYVNQMGDKNANVFEYTLSHILFLATNGDNAAQERAKLVLGKLNEGSISFDKLAGQFSEDPNFTQGGVLGTFKAGEMLPEMEAAVKGLSVGETTNIVKTKVGLHIVKVTKKKMVPNPAFEAKKEEVRGLLFAQAFKKQFRQWLDNKRREAFIRIN